MRSVKGPQDARHLPESQALSGEQTPAIKAFLRVEKPSVVGAGVDPATSRFSGVRSTN
jgi:hypothetical protein